MKTAISIPDPIFRAAEKAAEHLAISRSELYTKAIQEFLNAHPADGTTEKLNQVYAGNESTLDPRLSEMQTTSISADSW